MRLINRPILTEFKFYLTSNLTGFYRWYSDIVDCTTHDKYDIDKNAKRLLDTRLFKISYVLIKNEEIYHSCSIRQNFSIINNFSFQIINSKIINSSSLRRILGDFRILMILGYLCIFLFIYRQICFFLFLLHI